MNYRKFCDQTQERVNDFLDRYAFFAFSMDQYREGMEKLNIDEADKGRVVSIGSGGFMLREMLPEYVELAQEIGRERKERLADPETGEKFAFEMFYCELCDHEYCISQDPADALEALSMDLEEIEADPMLSRAFKAAREKAAAIY